MFRIQHAEKALQRVPESLSFSNPAAAGLIRTRSHRMASPDKETKFRLLKTMLESRHADLREQNLNRQGKGHFHVSGMGHEALAAISFLLGPDDYIVPYYRDRGLVLGRGMTTRQLGLEYFAKRNTGKDCAR